MADDLIFLPPDPSLVELANRVNAAVPQGAGINFYRVEHPDGRRETGIIFSFGNQRASLRTQETFTEHDAPRFIKSLAEWSAHPRFEQKWTADPHEAGLRA